MSTNTASFAVRSRLSGANWATFRVAASEDAALRRNPKVGPFSICIATFEQELERSTHPTRSAPAAEGAHRSLRGLAIYRDGLRVMPYGRRTPTISASRKGARAILHAGRAFMVYRRTFGRVAVTRADNPNPRDKAGREGLIDNRCKVRRWRILVIDLLNRPQAGTSTSNPVPIRKCSRGSWRRIVRLARPRTVLSNGARRYFGKHSASKRSPWRMPWKKRKPHGRICIDRR